MNQLIVLTLVDHAVQLQHDTSMWTDLMIRVCPKHKSKENVIEKNLWNSLEKCELTAKTMVFINFSSIHTFLKIVKILLVICCKWLKIFLWIHFPKLGFWINGKARLKYDDTHSDQKFSESELYPLITWKHPRNASSLRGKAPSVGGNAYETPTQWGGTVNFQRISGQNGCHHVCDALYILLLIFCYSCSMNQNWLKSFSELINKKWTSSGTRKNPLSIVKNRKLNVNHAVKRDDALLWDLMCARHQLYSSDCSYDAIDFKVY